MLRSYLFHFILSYFLVQYGEQSIVMFIDWFSSIEHSATCNAQTDDVCMYVCMYLFSIMPRSFNNTAQGRNLKHQIDDVSNFVDLLAVSFVLWF